MAMRLNLYSVCIFVFLFSCKKKDPNPVLENPSGGVDNAGKVWVINEGNFGGGNASLSIYDYPKREVENHVFSIVNQIPLGDVAQSVTILGDYAYVLVNNSSVVYKVEKKTKKIVHTLSGMVSPRYFLPLDDHRALISDLYADKIHALNLNTGQLQSSIISAGWTEEMVLLDDMVFACKPSDNAVLKINTTNLQAAGQIDMPPFPVSIVKDKNNFLWVLCRGNLGDENGHLVKYNPIADSIDLDIPIPLGNQYAKKINIDGSGENLFVLIGDLYKMNINAVQLPSSPLVLSAGRLFYGLGIDPYNDLIYLSDAIDYQQKGLVYVYDFSGQEKDAFDAGIIPSFFAFEQ